MADEIRQDMGFDAAQALETLNQLNTGFDKFFQTLNAAPRTFDAFNSRAAKTVSALIQIKKNADAATASLGRTAGANLPGGVGGGVGPSGNAKLTGAAAAAEFDKLFASANSAGNAATAAGKKSEDAFNRARRSSNGFALSLETVVRVLGTQLIVRSLNSLLRGVEQSFGKFIEFQQSLATIRTILPSQSINSLSEELVNLSNNFNVPLLDVVHAKYEIIQNGFESAAESTQILTAALKFARITNADAAASADLISSSLNAYSQAASEAETVTAKLVKTIEIGRVSGSELVAAFGRVAPIGKEIGATTDELLAAFSSITIGGVRASEAATQIRATLSALLKPSEAMKEAFKKVGVETGDQAIQTFGLKGALDQLIGTTNGSTASIAKLFPNIRALNGVLRETGSGADIFTSHIKEIQKTATEVLNKKFELRIETNAEKVAKDFNKFTNFLTTEVGKTLVETTAQAVGLAGGVDNIINAAKSLAPIMGVGTAAIIAYSVATASATGLQKLFNLSLRDGKLAANLFGGALSAVFLVIAAIQGGKFAGRFITDKINEGRKKLEEDGQQLLQHQREQDAARNQLAEQANKDRFRLLNQQIAETRKAYTEQLEIAKVNNASLIADDKSTLDRIIEAHDKFAQDLKRAAQDAENQVLDSRKQSNDLILKLEDERFKKENDKQSKLSQLINLRRRSEQVAALARKQLAAANTDEEARAARVSFDRSEAFAQQALESAKTLNSTTAIAQEERRIEQMTRSRIAAELRFQKIRQAEANQLRAEAAKEEERVGKLKILAKEFLEKSNLFDTSGNRLPEDQVTKNVGDAKRALSEFQRLAFDKKGAFSIGDLFSFDSLQRRLQQSVADGEVEKLFASDRALDGLVAQIQGNIGRTEFVVNLLTKAGIDTTSLKGLSDPDALARSTELLQEQEELVNRLDDKLDRRKDLERQIAESRKLATDSFKAELSAGEKRSKSAQLLLSGAVTGGADARKAVFGDQAVINSLRTTIQKALDSPNLTKELVDHLAQSLDEFSKNATVAVNIDVNRAAGEFKQLKKVLESQLQVKELEKEGVTEKNVRDKQEALQNATSKFEAEIQVEEALKRSRQAQIDTTNASISFATQSQSAATSTGTIATNLASAAQSMARMNQTTPGAAPTLSPTLQPNGANLTASAPRTATPTAPTATPAAGATNVNLTQNITTNDARQFARDTAQALNREIRRNASVLRTA